MRVIEADQQLLATLNANPVLKVADAVDFEKRYRELATFFHSFFPGGEGQVGFDNAMYHRIRYIDLINLELSGNVLDIGNDKPFLSYYLRALNPAVHFTTISFETGPTPVDLFEVDIECEPFPFADLSFDYVIMAEVLEHLWRDPAFTTAEMNRVLKLGGKAYVTTPNACEYHAIVCILFQANPNQRNQFYTSLDSGHLHLWTAREIRSLFSANGFNVDDLTSYDGYGYTKRTDDVVEFINRVAENPAMMNEMLRMWARKIQHAVKPVYPSDLFPSGKGVQIEGSLASFLNKR